MGVFAKAHGDDENSLAYEELFRLWNALDYGSDDDLLSTWVHDQVFQGKGEAKPYAHDICAAWDIVTHFLKSDPLRPWGMMGRVVEVGCVDYEWFAKISETHWDSPEPERRHVETWLEVEVREFHSAPKAICFVALLTLAVAKLQVQRYERVMGGPFTYPER